MNRTWADFAVWDARPAVAAHWLLPDTGWFAILAWTAGPDWVVATSDRSIRAPVRVACIAKDGARARWEEPYSSMDHHGADDDVDQVLAEVGLPARPRGCDWYLSIAPEIKGEIVQQIGQRVHALVPREVSGEGYLPAVKNAMEIVVEEILRASVRPDD
ncbi:MAG: hypothetical protein JWP10_175 [Nocardioidaceae bacterium]|nr:hypothetical protein [Nocardioidaceae bacterium]